MQQYSHRGSNLGRAEILYTQENIYQVKDGVSRKLGDGGWVDKTLRGLNTSFSTINTMLVIKCNRQSGATKCRKCILKL